MARKKKAPTRGERNIAWIEQYCLVPEGRLVGQAVKLRDWQKDALLRIYDNPAGTRRAILSFGRKNGKTALSACILLLHLCGPEARPNSQLYSAAQSREQAAILFALAAKMVRMHPDLNIESGGCVIVRDTAKQLACPELGSLYRALSAEASTAYGLSPVLIVHDELGQVKGPRSELYEALETATGAQENPLSIVISTQAPTDADLLSVLIEDAKAGHDPRVVLSLHTAPEDLDPFSEEAIRAANPAFGDFQNAEETLAMAEDARRMPSREAEYRNLILNQRVDMNNPFVSQRVWQECGGPVVDDFAGLPVFGGLDLSEVSDLTALVLVAPVDGIWNVRPTFWLPGQGLAEKARQDRVPYDVWARDGWLQTSPGATVDYEFVAAYLWDLCEAYDVRKLAFDRWNWRHLKPWLLRVGFNEEQLEGDEAIFEQFGQGFASMSPALRDLESALLNKRIAHGGHPVLESCARNATVQMDPAGNRKLSKSKSHGRIDGMVALAMAMSVAGTWEDTSSGPSVYEERGILMI
ncbi:terminase large subunit [Pseudogemmobacter sonorensis]|uniref:terminase large subunit n=1 Tax=Pseudogemmobacter sonorensis TaxID=2989681 RepID=UPI0036AD4EE2